MQLGKMRFNINKADSQIIGDYQNQIERFLVAQDRLIWYDESCQERIYDVALAEIQAGRKQTHWIWFIFPQIRGLGHSSRSFYYGLTKGEAKDYSNHSVLSMRLKECCNELLKKEKDVTAVQIFGQIDARKVKSSMTLFYLVSGEKIYKDVLERFYGGELDSRTLSLLRDNE